MDRMVKKFVVLSEVGMEVVADLDEFVLGCLNAPVMITKSPPSLMVRRLNTTYISNPPMIYISLLYKSIRMNSVWKVISKNVTRVRLLN